MINITLIFILMNTSNEVFTKVEQKQQKHNNEILENLVDIIHENRINKPMNCWVNVGAYKEDLAIALKERGFTISHPRGLWEIRHSLYIRDDVIYNQYQQKCVIL